ncbi:hypothetical protein ACEN32_12535 [Marinilactibacillus psychrotolerans]|uniref:Uncharacterized protein n=1 Tax=Marinilactibacillus psychrotolerans 42ea TaxID=1255609 RepID=A0A1R4K889_9LACT|nr:hypothetical protein FM115_08485 [Marinilactibacillus psychrotolerans 42ea]
MIILASFLIGFFLVFRYLIPYQSFFGSFIIKELEKNNDKYYIYVENEVDEYTIELHSKDTFEYVNKEAERNRMTIEYIWDDIEVDNEYDISIESRGLGSDYKLETWFE